MNRHRWIWRGTLVATVAWLTIGPTTKAQGASVTSTAAIASAAVGQGNDFWEDRFNAMQRIWGTPYVPLGYYWDQARGLPPRQAPVAPGIYSDQPIYPSGGFGYGYGRHPGWGGGSAYRPGLYSGLGFSNQTAYPYAYDTSYPYGYNSSYGSPYSYGYGTPYGYGYGSGVGIGFQLGIGSRVFPRYGSPYGGFYGW